MTFNSQLLSENVNLLSGGETVKVRRFRVRYERGEKVEDLVKEFDLVGNIQPITGRDLLNLEEGERKRQQLRIFSRSELQMKDIVCRENKTYEVKNIERWGPFFESRAELRDVR